MLQIFNFLICALTYSVDTDESVYQVAVDVFETDEEDFRRSLWVWSRKTNVHEQNYSVREKYFLTVVWDKPLLKRNLSSKNFSPTLINPASDAC